MSKSIKPQEISMQTDFAKLKKDTTEAKKSDNLSQVLFCALSAIEYLQEEVFALQEQVDRLKRKVARLDVH
jgi:polyhydroxyalkanoate synthesis regulator phasin